MKYWISEHEELLTRTEKLTILKIPMKNIRNSILSLPIKCSYFLITCFLWNSKPLQTALKNDTLIKIAWKITELFSYSCIHVSMNVSKQELFIFSLKKAAIPSLCKVLKIFRDNYRLVNILPYFITQFVPTLYHLNENNTKRFGFLVF